MSFQDTLQKLKEINADDLRNIDINNVGVWPLAAKAAVWVAVFAAVLFMLYSVNLNGLLETFKAQEAKEVELRVEFERKVNDAANLEEYRAQMIEMEASFEALLKQLPQDTEVPGLLDDISGKGQDSGLTFNAIDLKPEHSEEFYVELPIEIKVVGGYHDFGTFASGIAGLPRIVMLDDFSIAPSSGSTDKDKKEAASGELLMTITAKTFRYRPKEQDK